MDIVEKKIDAPYSIRHPWETARLEIIKYHLKRISCLKSKEDSAGGGKYLEVVLDIGCGDIFVAQSLASIYPNVQFICVDTAFTNTMIDNMKSTITTQNIYLYSSIDEAKSNMNISKIDIVLLLDVIEHIENDIEFLKKLKAENELLLKNAFWLITVPAFQKLFCQHDIFLGHYRRYTNAMLKQNLQLAGFQILVLNYFFFLLLIPRIFKLFLGKINFSKNQEKGIGQWDESVYITKIIHYFLWIDFRISNLLYKFKIKIPGLSNFCICKSV